MSQSTRSLPIEDRETDGTPSSDLGRVSPKVSVLLITYNHERYIAQAIESVLMQETTFPVVINVIEDCSTDRTASIVLDYAARYPGRVVPYLNKKNIGREVTQRNFARGFRTLDGDYWALLEGDDYWTSKNKLQMQVDFLEQNPDFSICAHNTLKVFNDGSKASHRFLYYGKKADADVYEAILLRMFFHTTGVLYRNVFKGVPPRGYDNKWSCDIYIFITHAAHGKIHHIDEDMAVYRAHSGGLFSTMSDLNMWKYNIGGLQRYNVWMEFRFFRFFSESIVKFCDHLLTEAGKNGVPALTTLSLLKYRAIRAAYSIAHGISSIPASMHRALLFSALRGVRGEAERGSGSRRLHRPLSPTALWILRAARRYRLSHPRDLRASVMHRMSLAFLTGLERVLQLELSPDPLPRIQLIGPQPFEQGKPFNIQQNGESAMWMQVEAPPPHQTVIVFGGIALRTSVENSNLTAIVPLHMIANPGLVPVWIEAAAGDGTRVSEPTYIEVVPIRLELPLQLPSIEALGPQPVYQGEPFNVQSDGGSAIWVRLDGLPPDGTRLVFGGITLPVAVDGTLLTASIPHEMSLEVGDIQVGLEIGEGEKRLVSETVLFEVRPRQTYAPVQLPSIEALGPQPVYQGEPFNVQSDGGSAIWVRLDGLPPDGTRLVFDGTTVPAVLDGLLVTAKIPSSLTARVGKLPVWLEYEQGGQRLLSDLAHFEVRPSEAAPPLPARWHS